MKKFSVIVLCLVLSFSLTACEKPSEKAPYPDANGTDQITETNELMKDNIFKSYSKNPDGTFESDGITYKYRLEIRGRMPNASQNTVFIYLSNLENISFEQAWKATGLSSNSNDYFDAEDAVLVELWTEK